MHVRPLFAIALLSVLTGPFVLAQQPDIAPGAQPPAAPSGQPSRGSMGYNGRIITSGGMRPESRIPPPGIWWRNPDLIQKLSLTPDQQKRMDEIFQQSRLQLIDLKAAVEKQEVLLEPLLAANPPDTNKVLAQIDHTAQARAELEKANAKMLLGIRNVLTPDQWTKLQAEERENRRMMMRDRGMRRGPDGPDGMLAPPASGEPAPAAAQ